jgi:hypothetical protein
VTGTELHTSINDPDLELAALEHWRKSEHEAAVIAATHDGPIIVDLDETLYLRNSTEQFIALAAPGFAAALCLLALSVIKPWRWAGGSACRDNWRVMLIMVLFPWTIIRWRRFCARNAQSFINVDLEQALRSRRGELIIASNGYRRIIEPLVDAINLSHSRLICCNLRRFSHRTGGKLELVRPFLDKNAISTSAVITDSMSDKALLSVCAVPCLTIWHLAKYEPAFRGAMYFPGYYLAKVKRPGQSALKSLVFNDLLIWLLVGVSLPVEMAHILGLIFLFFSMWAFYELGYYDNDVCGLRYEKDPRITAAVKSGEAANISAMACATGVVLGLSGIALINKANILHLSGLWFSGMFALTMVYRYYNRIDKESRVWLYLPLQIFRSGALFLVVQASGVALAVIGSQILARWIDYIIYRHQYNVVGATSFPERPQKTVRLVLCLLFVSAAIAVEGWHAILVPAMLGVPYFLLVPMRSEIPGILRRIRRIDNKVANA